MDLEEDWDLSPFPPAKDFKKGRLEGLSRKSPNQLSPLEIFKLIDASVLLDKFIPAALSLMEQGRIIDLHPDFCVDHWTLLERQASYFKNNPAQEKRLVFLKKKRNFRESRNGKSDSCFECHDGKGGFKRLYESRPEAISSAEYRNRRTGVQLDVYPCRHKEGWHITKA